MAYANTSILESIIGRDELAKLVKEAGGLHLYVAKAPPLSGPLARLSPAAQARLAQYAGGSRIYIPRCAASMRAYHCYAAIRAAYAAGERVRDIAIRHGCTERWVRSVISRQASDDGKALY